eukprot:188220-Chlamydomonas_euryale.AAC.2
MQLCGGKAGGPIDAIDACGCADGRKLYIYIPTSCTPRSPVWMIAWRAPPVWFHHGHVCGMWAERECEHVQTDGATKGAERGCDGSRRRLTKGAERGCDGSRSRRQ